MKKVKVYVRRCSFCMGKCRDEGGARCAYCSGTGQRATTIDVEPSKVLETCDLLNGVVIFDPNEPLPAIDLSPKEAELRAEFERQHEGRDLARHPLRGTYYKPPIAALWNQHCKTAEWMAGRTKGAVAKLSEDEASAIAAAVWIVEAAGSSEVAGILRGILNADHAERHAAPSRRFKLVPIDAPEVQVAAPAPSKTPSLAPPKKPKKSAPQKTPPAKRKAQRPAQEDLFNNKKGK